MLVLDTADAHADIAALARGRAPDLRAVRFFRAWRRCRAARSAVGFSLAFVSNPAAPWLGHFACQHFRPDYYAQPQFMTPPNTAQDDPRRLDLR